MSDASGRWFSVITLAVIVALTLSTAYIHYWVGGMMLMLNAAGYLGLVVMTVGSFFLLRPAYPLILLALAAYAAATIAGWLIMGPYFDVAYLAKAIEIGLIATIAFTLLRSRSELDASITWGRPIISRVLGRGAVSAAGLAHEE